MLKVRFEYNTPHYGEITVEGPTDDWIDSDIMAEIIDHYPDAIDIEIVEQIEIE